MWLVKAGALALVLLVPSAAAVGPLPGPVEKVVDTATGLLPPEAENATQGPSSSGGAVPTAGLITGLLGGPVMQEEEDHPAWQLLSAMPVGPARWAQLLVEDGNGNRRTDFLDIAAAAAYVDPLLQAEILVYGSPAAHASIQADAPDAMLIEGPEALFVTWPLADLDLLDRAGVDLMVWEPRAGIDAEEASTDPAGGDPASFRPYEVHGVAEAWSAGYTGSGTRIAVLDTGVASAHDALRWQVASFHDCVGDIPTAYDDNGHGTHVASIAAGKDGTQFLGAAYNAQVVAVKTADATGAGTLADFHCGIDHVLDGGSPRADVAVFSSSVKVPPLGITTLNGGPLDVFGWDRAAARLPLGGVPLANSAGNHPGTVAEVHGTDESLRTGVNGVDQVASPGFADEVIAVGATDRHRAMAHFSALGPGKTEVSVKPDVVAQGMEVWGALHDDLDGYAQWDGTSMSAPIVAGILALLVQKDPGLDPEAYAELLRQEAASTCIATLSQQDCSIQGIGTQQAVRPSTIDGYGYVRAKASLDQL